MKTKTETKAMVMPYGKFRGQPLENLCADPGYLDWLIKETDFKNKYKDHYTFIINNFCEPDDTPEHNDFHIQFLDDDYCLKFLKYYSHIINIKLTSFYKPYFEPECGGDVLINYNSENSNFKHSLILE